MENSNEVPLDRALAHALAHFPGWARRIEAEYRRSETFRALCDDWWVCAEARDRWHSSQAPKAVDRRREYREWYAELEEEIEEWLQRPKMPAGLR